MASVRQRKLTTFICNTAEDTPSFDYGGFVVGEQEEEAVLLAKKPVRPD